MNTYKISGPQTASIFATIISPHSLCDPWVYFFSFSMKNSALAGSIMLIIP